MRVVTLTEIHRLINGADDKTIFFVLLFMVGIIYKQAIETYWSTNKSIIIYAVLQEEYEQGYCSPHKLFICIFHLIKTWKFASITKIIH